MPAPPAHPPLPPDLTDRAVERVTGWLRASAANENADDRELSKRLHDLIGDPDGVAFTMQFVDRVIRPTEASVAARQLNHLVRDRDLPGFLGPIDRLLLRAGARLAPLLPSIVMPLARRRMRQMVGHLVIDSGTKTLPDHLSRRRAEGFAMNVNLLGEAVLGEREAKSRLGATLQLLELRDVDYVSVKISGVASQLNHWAWETSLDRISARLRHILEVADRRGTFVNLDMEEYHDLELTMAAFCRVLDEEPFEQVEAGIVLQAYLPDSFPALQHLVGWATERLERGGAGIKIRLVKGANLAMEKVDATIHNWTQAPYDTKDEVDANYKRCVDWAFTPEHTAAVRFGVGSHNLFDVAFARLVAEHRGVADRVEMEMLEGMAPTHARTVRDAAGGLLLYTPVVDPASFDVAISYLFRRLDENAAVGNFVHDLADMAPGTAAFAEHEQEFRRAVEARWEVAAQPRRAVDRTAVPPPAPDEFVNEAETDAAVAANRAWAAAAVATPPGPVSTPTTTTITELDRRLDAARRAQGEWAAVAPEERRRRLRAAADEFDRRRADLVGAMVHEANKCFTQIDSEICEAIDFARYYADRIPELTADGAHFEPYGVVAVIPPWNFPVAIPAGGMLAALAAGNAVIAKPAPETPRCAEIAAECIAVGLPDDVLQFVPVPEDDVGRHLVCSADAVILTGSSETAALFRSWKPDLRLFAETSGKNAIVITPNADIDLAVADLVDSAFGHAGQKCSAASLAICVGDAYHSERFRRQLVDAVESLAVGPPDDLATTVNPLIGPPNERLERGLRELDTGESWLVRPDCVDARSNLWRPGVRVGVRPGSWYHSTECFGPVLGIIAAADLDEAIAIQNSSAFGLTGGLHSLDPMEIDTWIDRVEVGNAYVNRGITGAIVQRQPFGGWKRSSVGQGAKAGGPNYVRQLGRWVPDDAVDPADDHAVQRWLHAAEASDREAWATEFGKEHDPTGLFCEANIFRYRPRARVALRIGLGVADHEVERVRRAARIAGVPLVASAAADESDADFAARLPRLGVERVRVLGPVGDEIRTAANEHWIDLIDVPVTTSGRVEVALYLREQAVSETVHRFGNLTTRRR